MKKLVILSGGMDSTVLLASVVKKYGNKNIQTITFNYGSKHNKQENKAAKKISNYYKVKNKLVKLDFIAKEFKSDLLKSGGRIPDGHYASPSMKRTVVPFRNGIMLSIAAGYAESIGAKTIYLGNHAGDHAIYPDCRLNFIKDINNAIINGTYTKIKLKAIFNKKTKTNICKIGHKLKAPLYLTYSCYKGGRKHCGKCGTCFERKEAFRDSKVIDKTKYL
jgi:7-cyano-7-deazaguanine synthase